MRVATDVGRRASLHASGVGKAILATLEDSEIRTILARTGLPARTPRTLQTIPAVLADVDQTRSRGYAVDDEEGELAVRCFAVAVARTSSPMALSVSAPVDRISPAFATTAVAALRSAAARISSDLVAS
jgi:IclR family acetate operon transcriptional repressor